MTQPAPPESLEALFRARYGADAATRPPPAPAPNPVLHTLLAHRSVRAFDTTRPLQEGTIEWLVAQQIGPH